MARNRIDAVPVTVRMKTTRNRSILAAAVLAALLATGACSSSDEAGQTSTGDTTVAEAEPEAPGARDNGGGAVDKAQGEADAEAGAPEQAKQSDEPRQQAVISTGTVSLESDDVGDARFEVQKIVDQQGGSISEQKTTTADDGDLDTARLVLRIPSEKFADAFAALEDLATLTSSTTGSEDVTTEVIDVAARIRAQEKSVARIETLLAEADSIQQIMSVEAELSRRQAELDSLKSQQKWLRDQTSLATITVHLERTGDTGSEDTDDGGFLDGLQAGWGNLIAALSFALTALGYALPWLVLLAVIGAPVWFWLRGSRRRRTTPAPAETP